MDSIFKKTLRAELDFQDIKVKELSRISGISARTLEGYLGARGSIPPADVAVKIADALGVTVEYLVTGKSERNKKSAKSPSDFVQSVSALPIEKKALVKSFVELLDDVEIKKKKN